MSTAADQALEIETTEIEEDEDYSNDDIFNINSWGADLSFRELISMRDEGELLKPELQRKFVWDKTEASRFVDSILLGLPVPSIFLGKIKDEKYLIIDGYQRITTVYDFVTGIYSQDNKLFKLSNSKKINERWRGKGFKELDEKDQRKIRSTTIHAIIFEQIKPADNDTSLYQIFERLNTTGRTLLSQEIRNCVYQGPLNTLLFELNKHKAWRKLLGQDVEDLRMRDLEFMLRFFALGTEEIRKSKLSSISLKKHLNEFMGEKSNNSAQRISQFSKDFLLTIDTIGEFIGANAFRNLSADAIKYSEKFHPAIFDSIAIATLFALKNKIDISKISDMDVRHKTLLRDKTYSSAISTRTTNISSINGRISKVAEILYGIKYE